LDVACGRTAALIGRPGAGKSIFIRTLLGRLKRSGGELRVCGCDPSVSPQDVAKLTTYVGNPSVLEPNLTTLQNVVLLLQIAGAPVPAREAMIQALRDVDVPDRVVDGLAVHTTPLQALSTWLALARLRASSLVLLDDPTAFLTPSDASHLASLVQELADRGPAVLVTTRDARFAEECASVLYLLESGRILPAVRTRLSVEQRDPQR